MNRNGKHGLGLIVVGLGIVFGGVASAQSKTDESGRRMVLVELFTSQGCDMCPTAEAMLGTLAEKNPRIVPVAFHVDYFNTPWEDTYSDPLYSQRQATYNQLYKRPKNPEYGLYYTPMLMIDGIETVNGRDPETAQAVIRKALARKPGVKLEAKLEVDKSGLSGNVAIVVSSLGAKSQRTPLIVSAVVREDGEITKIGSGENAGKSLKARYPARITKYEPFQLETKATKTQNFALEIKDSWDRDRTRVAVFVQDLTTGEILQSADLPWKTEGSGTRPVVKSAAK